MRTLENKFVHVDYKKYLGPDWKPSDKKPCIVVSNHVSWADIGMNLINYQPSYVAKEGTKNIPFIGRAAEMAGSLFLKRASKSHQMDMYG